MLECIAFLVKLFVVVLLPGCEGRDPRFIKPGFDGLHHLGCDFGMAVVASIALNTLNDHASGKRWNFVQAFLGGLSPCEFIGRFGSKCGDMWELYQVIAILAGLVGT